MEVINKNNDIYLLDNIKNSNNIKIYFYNGRYSNIF